MRVSYKELSQGPCLVEGCCTGNGWENTARVVQVALAGAKEEFGSL